jgi:aerobic-type carbon monoxide dehydrogenase small subunit (CoxS/CutS family)
MELIVNGSPRSVPEVWREDSLLMVLREVLDLVGAKYGCGQAQCGACTVWLDGAPTRSCVTPVAAAAGRAVTTVEGLARGAQLHPVQQAWLDEQVPQCGYCPSCCLTTASQPMATARSWAAAWSAPMRAT